MRKLAVLLAILSAPALAQTPARIRGIVMDGGSDRMQVRTEDGAVTVMLPANVWVGAVRERTLDSIKPGEFVGSAAVRGRDGKLHAQEVHIFPESLRGTGEGHRPMEQPEQTMTNATVDGVAAAARGRTLHLRYAGGEQTLEVAPDVRVVEVVPGDRSLLVPGAAVAVRGRNGPGEAVTAVSIQAEKDGVKPLP